MWQHRSDLGCNGDGLQPVCRELNFFLTAWGNHYPQVGAISIRDGNGLRSGRVQQKPDP
jgi:hypothetical protein